MTTPYNSYSRHQMDNLAPSEQLGALFDRAAQHMENARVAIEKGDIQNRFEASEKAMAIMEGLLACLNRDTPERAKAAESLELYYRTMITMIGQVNVYNDSNTCKQLQASFIDMAQFWRQAGIELSNQNAEELVAFPA